MPRPWPVLLMARELGLGGSERQLAEIARSLDRSRFEPHVGCFLPEGIRGEELKRAGVPLAEFPVHSFRSLSTVAAAREAGRYMERSRIQLVHTFDTPANLFGVPTARFFGVPVVLSSQRAHRDLTPGLMRHLLRASDQIADGIVVNCETIRRHLIEAERVAPAKIRVCYNGIDTEQFRPSPSARPQGLEEATAVIGIVCALRPEKGLPTLLDAFRLVRLAHPGVKLAIVGDGPLGPELQQRSRALEIRDDCLFEPSTDRVADWLRAMDIFVLPSFSEALSNSLMEAMACGCAVVASRVGGNVELVRHGENGLLFDSGNAEQLAASLGVLIEQEGLRRRLASEASRFVRDNFALAVAARRMGEIYLEFLERLA